MKVILLQDIPKIGKKYQVANVAPGFARNRLIPAKQAEIATKDTLKKYEQVRLRHEQVMGMRNELLAKSLGDLSTMTVTITGKAGEKGHLFAGIHQLDIAKAIKEQTDIEFAPEHIVLAKAIKEPGTYHIQITVGEHRGKVTLEVKAESEE